MRFGASSIGATMTPANEQCLAGILNRARPDTGPNSPALAARDMLMPVLQRWAGAHLNSVEPSGSFAKGTANHPGTYIDLFISLKPTATTSLKDIYTTLGRRLTDE